MASFSPTLSFLRRDKKREVAAARGEEKEREKKEPSYVYNAPSVLSYRVLFTLSTSFGGGMVTLEQPVC